MKRYLKPGQLLGLVVLFLLLGCKDEISQPTPIRELRVLVVDSQNKPIPNAEVRVYNSAENWEKEQNSLASGVTDKAGIIRLAKLDKDRLWIKATWINHSTWEVYQNTLVNFEPIPPVPANSEAFYQVKVNATGLLKGLVVKRVEYTNLNYGNCDREGSYPWNNHYYCGYTTYRLRDASGSACDLYLLIEMGESNSSSSTAPPFFRSEVKIDASPGDLSFLVNDTITDFSKPYFTSLREHLVVNPEDYKSTPCPQLGEKYPTLGDYLASAEGQEYIFSRVDTYTYFKTPILNAKNSVIPSYPAQEVTLKLYSFSDQQLKLYLEWIY